MRTNEPREALDLIRAQAVRFGMGDADDPKPAVDGVMTDIEAVLDREGEAGPAYLDELIDLARAMLEATAIDDRHAERRVRFLRSILQLLSSRRSVGA